MAACIALLRSAGVLNKSTATKRASSFSRRSTATEHATKKALLQSTATEHSTEHSIDPENRFNVGEEGLEKIVALLLWMAQEFKQKISQDIIHNEVLDAIIKCGDNQVLHTASVTSLSKIIDIMHTHKDGSPKDPNATLPFMRRLARIRQRVLDHRGRRATERQRTSSRGEDNATEHVELTEAEVGWCYRRFGRNVITHELLPHQLEDDRYCLRDTEDDDTHLSTFQRSFVDNILRKLLGDKKVAFLIWQHGLPSIVDPPGKHDLGMLQSSLNECLHWYVALANDIAVHQTQEHFEARQSSSSLDEKERQRQQTRRDALEKARDALRRGARLARERDQNKRTFDDMDAGEQKMLEDYETGRAKKAKKQYIVPRMKPFRCKLQIKE